MKKRAAIFLLFAMLLLISVRVVQRHFDRIAEDRQLHVAVISAVVHVVDCKQIPLNRIWCILILTNIG